MQRGRSARGRGGLIPPRTLVIPVGSAGRPDELLTSTTELGSDTQPRPMRRPCGFLVVRRPSMRAWGQRGARRGRLVGSPRPSYSSSGDVAVAARHRTLVLGPGAVDL